MRSRPALTASTVAERIRVQVVHAERDGARIVELELPPGSTALNAVERSRLLDEHHGAGAAAWRFGIHGRECAGDTLLKTGDRVELYRPLTCDPKTQRRRRAALQPGKTRD